MGYIKDKDLDGCVLLPIIHDGKRMSLDDVISTLNTQQMEISRFRKDCLLEVYVDGSCNHEKGYGAWAIVSGTFQDTGLIKADNIGYVELYALYKALDYLKDYPGRIVVYTDSQYVYSNVNWKAKEYESLGWKSRSWRKRIPNKELLQKIMLLMSSDVAVEKINRKCNGCADRLAKKTMKKMV